MLLVAAARQVLSRKNKELRAVIGFMTYHLVVAEPLIQSAVVS